MFAKLKCKKDFITTMFTIRAGESVSAIINPLGVKILDNNGKYTFPFFFEDIAEHFVTDFDNEHYMEEN